MKGRKCVNFLNRNSLPATGVPLDKETTHSQHMFMGYHQVEASHSAELLSSKGGETHRYLLKPFDSKRLGIYAIELAKREWFAAWAMSILEQPYIAKTTVIQGDPGEHFVMRRFIRGTPASIFLDEAHLYPESVIPTQTIVDAFAVQTIVLSSTEFSNAGNLLVCITPEGKMETKLFKDTPVVSIDNERILPDVNLINYIKNLVFLFRQRRGDFSTEWPTNLFSRCWFEWTPRDDYPASPGWRRKMAAHFGRQEFVDMTLRILDPYLLLLSHRIETGQIKGPDELFISDHLRDQILTKHPLMRGAMQGFGLYPTELTSPRMPFNQGVDIVRERARRGERVRLSDCITGGFGLIESNA